jgi:hypothetical protein
MKKRCQGIPGLFRDRFGEGYSYIGNFFISANLTTHRVMNNSIIVNSNPHGIIF